MLDTFYQFSNVFSFLSYSTYAFGHSSNYHYLTMSNITLHMIVTNIVIQEKKQNII